MSESNFIFAWQFIWQDHVLRFINWVSWDLEFSVTLLLLQLDIFAPLNKFLGLHLRSWYQNIQMKKNETDDYRYKWKINVNNIHEYSTTTIVCRLGKFQIGVLVFLCVTNPVTNTFASHFLWSDMNRNFM